MERLPLSYFRTAIANQLNSMISLIEGGHRLHEQLWCGIYRCEVSYGVRLVESAIGLILLEWEYLLITYNKRNK